MYYDIIILIKIKNNQSPLDIEKIGADFYSYLKSNSFFNTTFYEQNIKNSNCKNKYFFDEFIHGVELKSYEFNKYKSKNDNKTLEVDILNKNKSFKLTKNRIKQVNWHWDMIIAFPPCTYLTVTGNRWFDVKKYGDDAIKRYAERKKAIQFFMMFVHAKCDLIAIENPLGVMSSKYQKPNQIIQPYEFGDPFEKQTCLWLKGLNNLMPTKIVQPPPRQKLKSGKSMPEWYSNAKHSERSIIRSKTFPGIAKAMAKQWSNPKNHNKQYILEL